MSKGDRVRAVVEIRCPSDFPEELSHLMHAGEPGLLRNCYVCWFYGGETETTLGCSYPSIFLEKYPMYELMCGDEWEDEAIEIPQSLYDRHPNPDIQSLHRSPIK